MNSKKLQDKQGGSGLYLEGQPGSVNFERLSNVIQEGVRELVLHKKRKNQKNDEIRRTMKIIKRSNSRSKPFELVDKDEMEIFNAS